MIFKPTITKVSRFGNETMIDKPVLVTEEQWLKSFLLSSMLLLPMDFKVLSFTDIFKEQSVVFAFLIDFKSLLIAVNHLVRPIISHSRVIFDRIMTYEPYVSGNKLQEGRM